MHVFAWTPERVQTMTELWSQGYSASQIANRLGAVSRNSVLGKLYRSGFLGTRQAPIRRPQAIKRPRAKVMASAVRERLRRMNVTPPPAARMIPLLDLERDDCRWPYGEGRSSRFCGCPKMPGLPYCEAHAQRAYRVAAIPLSTILRKDAA